MPLIETAGWRVPKEHHDAMLALARDGVPGEDHTGMDYQRSHPDRFFYRKTRTFACSEPDSDEESWFFVDEYDSQEDYDSAHRAYGDPVEARHGAAFGAALRKLIVPGSMWGPKVYFEQEPLTVDLSAQGRRYLGQRTPTETE